MTMITVEQLKAIAPHGKKSIIESVVPHLNNNFDKYGVNTFERVTHFLAQCTHECDQFKTLEEYASGAAYEGRDDLGNTEKGDGKRFKGRGIIQLTGRANYTQMSEKLGVDLVNNPELAETPEIAVLTAFEFWNTRKLNVLADKDDILAITKKINGGTNGLKDRKEAFARAKKVLREAFIEASEPVIVSKIPPMEDPNDVVVSHKGDKGNRVEYIQRELARLGYDLGPAGVDANFGPATEKAFKAYQKDKEIKVTGKYDIRTKMTMFPTA